MGARSLCLVFLLAAHSCAIGLACALALLVFGGVAQAQPTPPSGAPPLEPDPQDSLFDFQRSDRPVSGETIVGLVRFPSSTSFAEAFTKNNILEIGVCLPMNSDSISGNRIFVHIETRNGRLLATAAFNPANRSGPTRLRMLLKNLRRDDFSAYRAMEDVAVSAILGPNAITPLFYLPATIGTTPLSDLTLQVNSLAPARFAVEIAENTRRVVDCTLVDDNKVRSVHFDKFCKLNLSEIRPDASNQPLTARLFVQTSSAIRVTPLKIPFCP